MCKHAGGTGSLHVPRPSSPGDGHLRAAGPKGTQMPWQWPAVWVRPRKAPSRVPCRRPVTRSSRGPGPRVPSRLDLACGEPGTRIEQLAGSYRAAETGAGPAAGASSCTTELSAFRPRPLSSQSNPFLPLNPRTAVSPHSDRTVTMPPCHRLCPDPAPPRQWSGRRVNHVLLPVVPTWLV